MKDVLVSIIIPTYNNEKYIEKSITSVLKQTYKNIEVLIVNDGSVDKSEQKILYLQQKDSRIKYFKIENSGVSIARNIGLDNATGDLVGFVDADDYIEKHMIEILVEKSIKYSCDIVSCSYERIYVDKKVPEETYIKSGYYSKNDLIDVIYPSMFSNKELETVVPLSLWTKLFKRDLIEKEKIRFKPGMKSGEDLLFTRLLLLNAESFYYMPNNKLYKYRFNEASVTNIYEENKWGTSKASIKETHEIIDEYNQYQLDEQLPYFQIKHAISAILNIAKNEEGNKTDKKNELSRIIMDEDLQIALLEANYNEFSIKKKTLAFLMKKKYINLIYQLIIS